MEAKQRPQQPKGTLQERIERLQKGFTVQNFNIFPPALDKDLSKEEFLENSIGIIERLEAFINNGNSDEGLWFQYGTINGI